MRQRTVDVLTAAGLTLGVVVGTLVVPRDGGQVRPLDIVGWALLVVAGLAMAVRRRHPLPAAGVAAVSAVTYYACAYPGIFAGAPAVVGVYTLAGLGRRWPAAGLSVLLTGSILVAEFGRGAATHDGTLWMSGWLVAILVIGELVHGRRRYLEVLQQRAALAEQTREQAAVRRADEERLWIARELHDTLTHHISVITVQAGVALHLLDHEPDRVRERLTAIRSSGRDAMHELRATLGVLRQADRNTDGPGLARLPALVGRARSAGLTVTVQTTGEPCPLPEEVDRVAHRVVQEALTNVLRHAAGTGGVEITVAYAARMLSVRVDNEGAPVDPAPAKPGMGLLGLRERVVAVGGRFDAGPRPAGGFRVRAELPR